MIGYPFIYYIIFLRVYVAMYSCACPCISYSPYSAPLFISFRFSMISHCFAYCTIRCRPHWVDSLRRTTVGELGLAKGTHNTKGPTIGYFSFIVFLTFLLFKVSILFTRYSSLSTGQHWFHFFVDAERMSTRSVEVAHQGVSPSEKKEKKRTFRVVHTNTFWFFFFFFLASKILRRLILFLNKCTYPE